MTGPYAPAGSTLDCVACGFVLVRLVRDLERGDVVHASDVEAVNFPGPIHTGAVVACPDHPHDGKVLTRPDGTKDGQAW